jgi:hypothetical protein
MCWQAKKAQISSAQKLYTCTVRKAYSARNYQLVDEESTNKAIEFSLELPDSGRGTHQRNGMPLEITGSWMRNPQEEWNFF